MNDALTVAGFVALVTLLLVTAGAVASAWSRVSALSERLASMEATVRAHLSNGAHHTREE